MPRKNWEIALAEAKRVALGYDGITGVDFGFRYKGGERTQQRCLRFHVARKSPRERLAPHEMLPSKIRSLACDVVQAVYAPHLSPRAVCNPLCPGVSIGNVARQTTGTLGTFVRDNVSGKLCLLSNWHILCGAKTPKAGEPISQPGPLHLGSAPPRDVATLGRWLDPSQGYDAALAFLSENILTDPTIFALGFRISGYEEPAHGMRLVKASAVSGVTNAIVDGVGGAFLMDYTGLGDQKRWMDGVRLVPDPEQPEDEISLAGDSGAVWINAETQRAVALHFAGEDGLGPLAEYAVAHPISKVLQLLDVVIPSEDSAKP